ncbi:ABC transporter substrate-binding protein [Oleispirillum naphthae]|uniref:ABC transporter substrate-binding protein n=1 Tax=Oleispirillum naphthae TaxID=2838853 RepID=UPI0030824BAC
MNLRSALAVLAATLGLAAPARAAEPVKIGEINSYSRIPAFTLPYRNGWELAVEQINAKGGVLGGRPLAIIARDDAGTPEQALTAANELVRREGVVMLAGTYLSNVGLAVADYAAKRKVVFLASEPLTDAMVWSHGNAYTFRLRPSTYVQTAILAREAAKLPAKRWATIAPNYEYGQSAVDNFKKLLKAARPDVEFVAEQWPALFKLDAGPTVEALEQAKPDAIFNVTFSSDLSKFVREGTARGLFAKRPVVSLLTGEPDYLVPLGAETPQGWIVTGYPWDAIDTPAHTAFVSAYRARFHEDPRMGSLVGYNMALAAAAALDRAGSTKTPDLMKALAGLSFDSPTGTITFRAADHQSTMGAWVGKTALVNGEGKMVDWRYVDGAEVLPDAATAKKLRPAGKQ